MDIRLIDSRSILLIEIETELKHLSLLPEDKQERERNFFSPSLIDNKNEEEENTRERRFAIFLSSFTLSLLLTHIY